MRTARLKHIPTVFCLVGLILFSSLTAHGASPSASTRSNVKILSCSSLEAENIRKLHIQLREVFEVVLRKLNTDQAREVATRMFGNTLTQSEFETVKKRVIDAASQVVNANYVCSFRGSLWCGGSGGAIAVTPPPKRSIHLCERFRDVSEDKQIATLIHELMHVSGGSSINYLFESYCPEWTTELVPRKQMREADAYMLFIFELGTGRALECF